MHAETLRDRLRRKDAAPPARPARDGFLASIYAPVWEAGLNDLHTGPLKPAVAKVAEDTDDSATAQTIEALDLDPDELDPDFDLEDAAFTGTLDADTLAMMGVSLDRAEEIIDDWSALDPEEVDPDDLDDMLAEALDGVSGTALALCTVAFTYLFASVVKRAQTDAGVSQYLWLAQRDSVTRPAHLALDNGKACSWDDPPLTSEESSNEEDDHPGEDYNCVLPETPISFHAPATKCYRRWYRGNTTELVTAEGEVLRVTENHPVLTQRGWLPAHLVEIGDDLFQIADQRLDLGVANPQRRVPTAEEIFGALSSVGVGKRVAGRASWFHGDGGAQQVDVVDIDCGLLLYFVTALSQSVPYDGLALAAATALALGARPSRIVAMLHAAHSIVCRNAEGSSLLRARFRHARKHRSASITALYALLAQNSRDRGSMASINATDLQLANAVEVQAHNLLRRKIQTIVRRPFSGWVFNFETASGWFCGHGLIIHNCRCVASPIPPGEEDPDEDLN